VRRLPFPHVPSQNMGKSSSLPTPHDYSMENPPLLCNGVP